MIDSVGSARPVRHDDDDHSPQVDPRPAARADAFSSSALAAHIDGGLGEFVRNAAQPRPRNDDVLHVGMNRSAAENEIAELSPHAHVTPLAHGRDGLVQIAGMSYDLTKPAGRDAFAALLRARGLGAEQADAVVEVVEQTGLTGKDEIAHLRSSGPRASAVSRSLAASSSPGTRAARPYGTAAGTARSPSTTCAGSHA